MITMLARYSLIAVLLWPATARAGEATTSVGQATPPLQVLIRPRTEASDDPETAAADSPPIADFRDAYVVLPDGRFMSFADWITGVVAASGGNADPSEFERRLAHGEVGAVLAGRAMPPSGPGMLDQDGVGDRIGGRFQGMTLTQIAAALGVDLASPAGQVMRGIYDTSAPINVVWSQGDDLFGRLAVYNDATVWARRKVSGEPDPLE